MDFRHHCNRLKFLLAARGSRTPEFQRKTIKEDTKRPVSHFHSSVAALAISAGFATPALAQAAPDSSTQQQADAPPEIIVTAERREANLQKEPQATTTHT